MSWEMTNPSSAIWEWKKTQKRKNKILTGSVFIILTSIHPDLNRYTYAGNIKRRSVTFSESNDYIPDEWDGQFQTTDDIYDRLKAGHLRQEPLLEEKNSQTIKSLAVNSASSRSV